MFWTTIDVTLMANRWGFRPFHILARPMTWFRYFPSQAQHAASYKARAVFLYGVLSTILFMLCCGHGTAQLYTVTPLSVGNANYVAGEHVSDNGRVAVGAFDGADLARAFWFDGAIHALAPLVAGGEAYANSINNSGTTVGYSFDAAGERRAVLWNAGVPMNLGTLGGNRSEARGINNLGVVVGSSRNAAGTNRPFRWSSATGMEELSISFGGPSGSASAINDAGQIAGFARDHAGNNRAYHYDATTNTLINLGTLGGPDSFANGISSNGFVAGLSDAPGNEFRPFFWSAATGMLDIFSNGNLGEPFGAAYDVNSAGEVVGYGEIDDQFNSHAFIWSQTDGLRNLNTLISPASGWELLGAAGINDVGQIVGWGRLQGAPTGFLLTPIPEPTAWGMVVLIMGLVIRRRLAGVPQSANSGVPRSASVSWKMVALVLSFIVLRSARADLAPAYLVTGLGTLPGGVSSTAFGINDLGVVVGTSTDVGGSATLAAFRWQAGVMTNLGLYPSHTALRPWGINNLGKIAGRATNGPGGSNYGVYYNGSEWVLAGWVGGTRGNAFGINDANQVVGNMRLPSGDFSRAFVWTPDGGTVQLPTIHPEDPNNGVPAYNGFEGGSYATGINAAGVVVGSSGISDTHGSDRAFRWTIADGMVNLGTPASQGVPGLGDYTNSYAQNINNMGIIVGAADRGPGLTRAVYWDTNGQLHDIGTLGGTRGWAYGINEQNVIVGQAHNAAGQNRAFGFVPGGSPVDLNNLLHPSASGWTLLRANDINESGWIVGEGVFNGITQAVLLTPIPEPVGYSCFALVFVFFLGVRRCAQSYMYS